MSLIWVPYFHCAVSFVVASFCFKIHFLFVFPFPEGHDLASRLSKVIQRETEAVKSALAEFNSATPPTLLLLSDPPAAVSWTDITDTTSAFWMSEIPGPSVVPAPVRRQSIAARHNFDRAVEEINLLKDDMLNFVKFFGRENDLLRNTLSELRDVDDQFSRGAAAVLTLQLREVEATLGKVYGKFLPYIPLPNLPIFSFRSGISSDDVSYDDDEYDIEGQEEEQDEDWEEDEDTDTSVGEGVFDIIMFLIDPQRCTDLAS